MCKGYVLEGAPFIKAFVIFPAHEVTKEYPPPLDFLIDTGASVTMISALDAEKLGIRYKTLIDGRSVPHFGDQPLKEGPKIGGVGGSIQSYIVKDVKLKFVTLLNNYIEFHEEHLKFLYIPDGRAKEIPNILGRDVINRFKFLWDDKLVELSRGVKPGVYTIWIMGVLGDKEI